MGHMQGIMTLLTPSGACNFCTEPIEGVLSKVDVVVGVDLLPAADHADHS